MNVLSLDVRRYLRLSLLAWLVCLALIFASGAAKAATFTPLATFGYTAGYGFSTTQLNNGKVLLAGGTDGTATFATIALFDPANGTLTTQDATLATARYNHTATLLRDGRVLLADGRLLVTGGNAGNSLEIADASASGFTTISDNGIARFGHTATVLPNGRVLIADGSIGGSAEGSAEIFNPADNSLAAAKSAMWPSRSWKRSR